MKFDALSSYSNKGKYFYRLCKWDWENRKSIYVIDNKKPRIITMDYWPQTIYLAANGDLTVSDFIYKLALKYPYNQVPSNLDIVIIDDLEKLVKENTIEFSDSPVLLDNSILNPMTEEAEVDMIGKWKGTYTYEMYGESSDNLLKEVEFDLMINEVNKKQFIGTVEDNLSTGGTPGKGSIKGSFSDYEILFEKNMPVYTELQEDGSSIIDKNKKHPTLVYTGEFSRNKKVIVGQWKFKKKVLVWNGLIPRWSTLGSGYFKMEKE